MRTAYFTLAVAAALAATTANAVHLNAEPHLEADLEADLEAPHKYTDPNEETTISPKHFNALLRNSNDAEVNTKTGEKRWKAKEGNPKRLWEPMTDDLHVWCFCKVDVLSLDVDEGTKTSKEKDVKALFDSKQGTQRTKQQANYTQVKKGLNKLRTIHEGCPGYTNDDSAKKKGFYACQTTPLSEENDENVPMELRYPENFYGNSDRSDNFNIATYIGKKTVQIVLKIGATVAVMPIIGAINGGLFAAGTSCDLAENTFKAIW